MEKEIPEDIKKQIDLLVNAHYPTITRRDYRKYLEQGYTIASKEIEDAKAEIERLKELVNSENKFRSQDNKKECDHTDETGYVAQSICLKCGERIGNF